MNDLNIDAFVKALTYKQAEEVISTISKYFNIKEDSNDIASKELYDKVTEILNYIDFDEVQMVDEILKNTAYGYRTFDFLFNKKIGHFDVARKIISGTYHCDDWDKKAFSVYKEDGMFEVCLRIEPKDCSYNLKYRNGKQRAIRRATKYFLPVFQQMGWEWMDEEVNEKTIYRLFEKLADECEKNKQPVSTGRLRASYNEENNTVSLSLELEDYSDW